MTTRRILITLLLLPLFAQSASFAAPSRPALTAPPSLAAVAQSPVTPAALGLSAKGLQLDAWCGTTRQGLAAAVATHRDHQRRLTGAGRSLDAGEASVPTITRDGDVALISDDGTVIIAPQQFDLQRTALLFKPVRGELRVASSGRGFKAGLGERLALGDDDAVEVELKSFEFPFFDDVHTSVYIHSDGNLTFTEPDASSSARSLGRLLSGPPRVAPLFADFDPSLAVEGAGVFVKQAKKWIRITWQRVPQFGVSNESSVQVTLFRNGKMFFVYGDVDTPVGVVGVSPGDSNALELVDLTAELPVDVIGSVAERFGPDEEIDNVGIARAFFSRFQDVYTHVVVWLDFEASLGNAFAFEMNVKNEVEGIGLSQFDATRIFGSDGFLESYLQMGTITNYPNDPDEVFLGTNSTMDIMGQEAGHRWLSFVQFRDSDGNLSEDLLGRDRSHWSFVYDSDASVMEGNGIRDNGDGTFTTLEATDRYSALDRYLMGLIRPQAVAARFYVSGTGFAPGKAPEQGVTLTGTPIFVSVNDIIAAEGPRVPGRRDAPKTFRMAFMVVSREGETPSRTTIDKVDTIRRRWEEYFLAATIQGRVDTTLLEQ